MANQRTIIGGGFQDSLGNPLSNGYLKVQLYQDVALSVQIGAGITNTLLLDTNGNVAGSPTLWAPAVYSFTAYTSEGQFAWQGYISIPDDTTPFDLTSEYPPLTLKYFNGTSGGGGGGNPLNATISVNYTPAIGDLLILVSGYTQGVNQIFQPGDGIPQQSINLQATDGVNTYTKIAYEEFFTGYAISYNQALAVGFWATIATNTTPITSITNTTNRLHDNSGSTGFTAGYNFFSYLYAFSPGRMPVQVVQFGALSNAPTVPSYQSSTNMESIIALWSDQGISSFSGFNSRNTFIYEHTSTGPETITPAPIEPLGSNPFMAMAGILI